MRTAEYAADLCRYFPHLKWLMSSTRPKESIWQLCCRSLRGGRLLQAVGRLCCCFWTCSSDEESPLLLSQLETNGLFRADFICTCGERAAGKWRPPPPLPPAVQHWVALISQFTLCFAASLGTMRYEVIVAAASAFSTYRRPVKSGGKGNCGTKSRRDAVERQAAADHLGFR